MAADGYSLDDKRAKQDGYGDLQDIIAKFHGRNNKIEADRTQKYFMVPRPEIEAEGYDLSLSRYKEDVFEEIEYEKPDVILQKLIASEVGDTVDDADLVTIQGGIVRELLELREMIG